MMIQKKKVHKFKNDDQNSELTACGWFIGRPNIVVNADSRKATCGNCQRVKSTRVVAKRKVK